MRRLFRAGLAGLVGLGLTVFLLEVALAWLCNSGRLPITKPSYSLANVRSRFWIETNAVFGVWHEPFSTYRHIAACYDVTYTANSYGARDRERSRASGGRKRLVVLGDSFAEGYGVAMGERLSDRLETATGLECLNFGTSGTFGPTQYYLLYKTLAKQFEHDAVLVCLLPDNDFLDDDLEYGKKVHAGRYRPYFAGQYPDYRLVYFEPQLQPAFTSFWKNFLREFSYIGIELKTLKDVQRLRAAGGLGPYSGYYDYTAAQLDRTKYILQKIREEAAGKTVILVTIPCLSDLERADRDGPPPLPGQLSAWCQSLGIAYLDLMSCINQAPQGRSACYLPCDRHWSAYGNQIAAECLLRDLPLNALIGPASGATARP